MSTVYERIKKLLEENPGKEFRRFELRHHVGGGKGSVSQAIERLKSQGLIEQVAGAWVWTGKEAHPPIDARRLRNGQ